MSVKPDQMRLARGGLAAQFSAAGARLTALTIAGVDVVMGAARDFGRADITAGAICGRIAGRIADARFPLAGRAVALLANTPPDQLHGGPDGFCHRTWDAAAVDEGLRFTLRSPDGDQGYPGEVTATATYGLTEDRLTLDLTATTTAPTVINLTNHGYWNLAGGGPVLDHEFMIEADQMLPLTAAKIPTGEIADVAGTRFDFRTPRPIGAAYDAGFVLRGKRGEMKRACRLRDPASGRGMEVWCTEALLQIYTADHWGPAMPGKAGPLMAHQGLALEAQNFPDAPNHPAFPSARLDPGATYHHRIEWRFR
ncbi:MAG TPA: aldose epimerase family protein [Aestuariivirga sp.]|nr:aldose epimerase family protein [Aestuariivirga sp.]